jgi:hypothetical protein
MSANVPRVRGVLFVLLHPKRFLTLVAASIAAVVYVWIAAVRAVPGVRRRKASFRERWRARGSERGGAS